MIYELSLVENVWQQSCQAIIAHMRLAIRPTHADRVLIAKLYQYFDQLCLNTHRKLSIMQVKIIIDNVYAEIFLDFFSLW